MTTHGAPRDRQRRRASARRRRRMHVLGERLRALDRAPPRRSGRTRRRRCGAARRRRRRRAAPPGPTTTSSAPSVDARAPSRPSPSSARTGWQRAERRRCRGCRARRAARSRRGLRASRHASACSRAPEPTSSTFTRRVYSGGRLLASARPTGADPAAASASRPGSSRFAAQDVPRASAAVTIDAARRSTGAIDHLESPSSSGRERRASGEHALARRADADELDRDAEVRSTNSTYSRAAAGSSSTRGRVVERLLPAGEHLPHRPAWWKSDWCAGKCARLRCRRAAGSATQTGISANADSTSSFVSASEVIPFTRTA